MQTVTSIASSFLLLTLASSAVVAQEARVVGPGRESLSPDVITPHYAEWTFVQIRDGAEVEGGTFARTTTHEDHTADEPAIFVRWHVTFPGRSALDIYYLHRNDLAQIARYQTGPNGLWAVYFSDDSVRGTYTRRASDPLVFNVPTERRIFNTAMVDMVLAALPLKDGYQTTLPVITTSASSMEEGVNAAVTATVLRQETLPAMGRAWDTWIVELTGPQAQRQHLWISRDAPYLIRRDVIGQTGDVSAGWRLSRVE